MKVTQIMQHLKGKTYAEVVKSVSVDIDDGGCCGYADCETLDHVKVLENAGNAVLHDVVKIEYDEDYGEQRAVVVNFIFDLGDEKGIILGYDMRAGSQFGCSCGAYCILKYDNEEVNSVEW